MSQKAVIKPYQVLTNGDLSGAVTSLPTDIESMDDVAYQVVFTGNAVGTFSVEGTINGTNWEALNLGDPGPQAEGTSGSFLVSLGLVPYAKLRLSYSAVSGTGVVNAWVMAKRLGG